MRWCSSVMLACNFLFCVAFLLPFGSWWWWPHRMSWECSSLHIFLEQFDQHRYYHISTFGSIHWWSPGHFFVGDFWSQLVVLVIDLFIVRACDWCWCLTYSYFLFLPGSVLEDCTFLRICPFVPGYPFYCHAVVSNCLLWSFLFLCCLLKRLLFHFEFIWVGCLLWGHIELDTTEAT